MPEKFRLRLHHLRSDSLLFGATLVLVAAAGMQKWRHPYPFDDAFMFLRYARNWVETGVPGFNTDAATYGTTSMTYTFLLSAGVASGLARWIASPERLLTMYSISMGVLSAVLLYRAMRRVAPTEKAIDQLLLSQYLLAPILLPQWFTGMDTTTALAAHGALIWAGVRTPNPYGLALFAFLAWFSRPDSLIYALIFPVASIWFGGLAADETPPPRMRRSGLIRFGVLFALLMLLDACWKIQMFGHWLPLPGYVKSAGFYSGQIDIAHWDLQRYYADFGWQFLLFPLLLSVWLPWRVLKPLLWALALPMSMTLFYLLGFSHIMGYNARFLAPSAPFALIGGMVLWKRLNEEKKEHALPALKWARLILLFMAFSVGVRWYMARLSVRETRKADQIVENSAHADTRRILRTRMSDGWSASVQRLDTLLGQMPDTVTIAITEHGWIGVRRPRCRIIDLCGLHEPRLALTGRWSDEIMPQEQPLIIWVYQDYIGLISAVSDDQYVRKNYQYYPDLLDGGVWIRKHTPFETLIIQTLKPSTD